LTTEPLGDGTHGDGRDQRFGRIGRLVFRVLMKHKSFKVVAINDIGAPEVNEHLLKYDSTHGRYPGSVKLDGKTLVVDGAKIEMLQEKDPSKLPWKAMGSTTSSRRPASSRRASSARRT
jgi:glyceraldehyde-3-phosphate dehydrogenase/erythrose-4-phosphate dehydrogenase